MTDFLMSGGLDSNRPISISSSDSESSSWTPNTSPKRSRNTGPEINLSAPPRPTTPPREIPATAFTPAYCSTLILEPANEPLKELLSHVNCSYLSTPGLAPSLLHLKKHAHDLCVLIKHLTVSTQGGVIDNASAGLDLNGLEREGRGGLEFLDGQSYDFLNDLSSVYDGPVNDAVRARHEQPLVAVMNTLQEQDLDHGPPWGRITDRCPLHYVQGQPANHPSLPYATHQVLIQHANEALELLDHGYSAKGGLLAILPPPEEKKDRAHAETTLLGQLIVYVQQLVERLHTLERLYANSLDILAGEAVVPSQALSRAGPSGRKGRELVYPQDRFVLVNAGDDVWTYLDSEFRKKEITDERVERMYASRGVLGESIWKGRGGKEMSRGITALDVTTRYYRLRNDPLKTVFIIPAHQVHPGTKATREMESAPTVVSVVKPLWPERTSTWEMKHRAELEELKDLRGEIRGLREDVEMASEEKKLLVFDNEVKDGTLRQLQRKVDDMESWLESAEGDEEKRSVYRLKKALEAREKEAERVREETQRLKDEAREDREQAGRQVREVEQERLRAFKSRREIDAQKDLLLRKREEKIAVMEEESAESAREVVEKMKAAWREKLIETEAIRLWFAQQKLDYSSQKIPEELDKQAETNVDTEMNL